MKTLEEIQTRDWSMAMDGVRDGDGLGEVVEGVDDVAQCIRVIITTPKGTDPLRPPFACDIYKYIDLPITRALPSIVREVTDAIALYELRAKVLSVLAERTSLAHLTVTVTWQPRIQGLTVSRASALTTIVTIGG